MAKRQICKNCKHAKNIQQIGISRTTKRKQYMGECRKHKIGIGDYHLQNCKCEDYEEAIWQRLKQENLLQKE